MFSKMLWQDSNINPNMFYKHFYPLIVAANGQPATPYIFEEEPREIYMYFHATGGVVSNVNPTTGVVDNNSLWRRNTADGSWTAFSAKFTVQKGTTAASNYWYRIIVNTSLSTSGQMGYMYVCSYASEPSLTELNPYQPTSCNYAVVAKNTYPTTTKNQATHITQPPRMIYLYANNSNTNDTTNKCIYTNQNPVTGALDTTVWKYTMSTGLWEDANTTFSVDSYTYSSNLYYQITLNKYTSTSTNTWCTWMWSY